MSYVQTSVSTSRVSSCLRRGMQTVFTRDRRGNTRIPSDTTLCLTTTSSVSSLRSSDRSKSEPLPTPLVDRNLISPLGNPGSASRPSCFRFSILETPGQVRSTSRVVSLGTRGPPTRCRTDYLSNGLQKTIHGPRVRGVLDPLFE